MATNDALDSMRALVQLAITTKNRSRDICGPQATITDAASNLQEVLERLEQGASTFFETTGSLDYRGDLAQECGRCKKTLDDSSSILLAYKQLSDFEFGITGMDMNAASFGPRQQAIIDHFRLQFTNHTTRLSHLLKVTALENLEQHRVHLDQARDNISAKINGATSIMMASGCFSKLAKPSKTDEQAWSQLSAHLLQEQLPIEFLELYKEPILTYAKTFRDTRAYDEDPGILEERIRSPSKASRVPQYDQSKRASRIVNDRRHSEPATKKRPRDDSDDRNEPSASKYNRKSNSNNGSPGTTAAGSGDSGTQNRIAQQLSLHHQILKIYYTLIGDYEPQCDKLMTGGDGIPGNTSKQRELLKVEIEKHIIDKLDAIVLDGESSPRRFRKAVIDQTIRTLAKLNSNVLKKAHD